MHLSKRLCRSSGRPSTNIPAFRLPSDASPTVGLEVLMRRTVFVAMLIVVGGLSMAAAGLQQQPPKLPTVRNIQKLRDNLYFISGGDVSDRSTWTGANVMPLVPTTGVVLVDTMLPGAGKSIIAQVKSVTDKPITTI